MKVKTAETQWYQRFLWSEWRDSQGYALRFATRKPDCVRLRRESFKSLPETFQYKKIQGTTKKVIPCIWSEWRDSNSRHSHCVPLAVPKIACSLFASHNFDRCAYEHSLHPPQAAVVLIAQTRRAPGCAWISGIRIFFITKIKTAIPKGITVFMVGVKRLELPTFWSQTDSNKLYIINKQNKPVNLFIW